MKTTNEIEYLSNKESVKETVINDRCTELEKENNLLKKQVELLTKTIVEEARGWCCYAGIVERGCISAGCYVCISRWAEEQVLTETLNKKSVSV
jgi:hypothetical protein